MNCSRGITVFGRCAVACLIAILLTSCSGFFPGKNTIVSMTISPTGAFIMPQATQQFSATATFGNNSTGDVTDQVTWTSSAPTITTIDTSGLATGVALGTATITAKSTNNVTATTPVTVSNKTVTALTINPQNQTISLSQGQTQQYTATATFSDGSFQNVTSLVAWTSSVTGVATITTSGGLATPVSVGSTTIATSYGGQAATANLTVTQ